MPISPARVNQRKNSCTSRLVEKLDAVMGAVQVLEKQEGNGEPNSFQNKDEPLICYNLGSLLARRAVFEKIGGFDARYRYSEDVDWFMRAQEQAATFEVLPDVVLLYRRHDENMTLESSKMASDLMKVLRASLDRRRKMPVATEREVEDIYYIRPGRLRV